jgi:hypothetical protein
MLAGGHGACAQTAPGTQVVNAQDSSAAVPGPVAANGWSYDAAPKSRSASRAVRNPAASTVVVPAGTRVLLALRNGVNTRSAQPGDGVDLTSTFPVVVGDRVAIPAGVFVRGRIDQVVKPGRGKGRAAVRMHFTTMIFPNGSVATIPGSAGRQGKDQGGPLEEFSSNGKDAGTVLGGAVGGIAGAAPGQPGEGIGAGVPDGDGMLVTLFTRGNDIMLEQGQAIEMVLEQPLVLTAANLEGVTSTGFAPVDQQRPVSKPRRIGILCPQGGLGCSN